jgi:hypothetical protein
LFDAAQDDSGLVPEALFGLGQFVVQVRKALTTPVLQFYPFQVVPDPLSRVQLRRISWQLLQVNTAGRTTAQVLLHHPAEERAIGWEEGHHYAYEVKNIGPIRSAYDRFSLNRVGEGETVLTQTLDFQMKLGPVGALMDTLVFRPQFRKQMEQSLAALKEYVEHNEAVDISVDLALTA